MVIGQEIERYRDDIVKHIQALVKIPSVMDKPQKGKPFGEGVNAALEYVLNLGESLGFKTKNVDGYAGHVEYGDGQEMVGILVHLDVVPEGEGWSFPPFGGTMHEGRIYGRGSSDNKGPAIVALYALKVLKDMGIQPHRRIRIIFGTNEESGWKDMEVYFSKEPIPDYGFSPDAGYPIINREKGILFLALTAKSHKGDGTFPCKIQEIEGGNAPNMVPDACRAFLPLNRLGKADIDRLEMLSRTAEGETAAVNKHPGIGYTIKAVGKSAHGAAPENGINAIASLVTFLQKVGAEGSVGSFIEFLGEKIGTETDGESMGVRCSDEVSGKLTLNLGKIHVDEVGMEALLDIRYPVTCSGEDIIHTIEEQGEKAGLHVEIRQHIKPLYVPENHILITKLKEAYRKITGKEAELLSMGGGTYARTLKNNGVAFGAGFPGTDTHAHQPDEFVIIDEMMNHGCICTQAIYELAVV